MKNKHSFVQDERHYAETHFLESLHWKADSMRFLERLEWFLVFSEIALSSFDEYQQVRPELVLCQN